MGLYIYKASENDKTHIFRIAATESDIDNFNLGSYTTITVSDSEYNNIRNSTKTVESYDGTTFTYLDNPIQEIAPDKTFGLAYYIGILCWYTIWYIKLVCDLVYAIGI